MRGLTTGFGLLRSLIGFVVFLAVLAIVIFMLLRLDLLSPVVESGGTYYAVDGDSLRNGAQDIRLAGIDAPELGQSCENAQGRSYACGQAARGALRKIIKGRRLSCLSTETDRYGRAIATCEADGVDIGQAMISQGWAITFDPSPYYEIEAKARQARLGLWAGRFERPSDYRFKHPR